MAEYIEREAVYKKACKGCTRHGGEIGSCHSEEPCLDLLHAFVSAPAIDPGTISRGVTWSGWLWKRGRGDRNLEINSGNLTRCISRISQGSGYTEKELSEKAGLGVNTIYFWRTGRSTPTIHLFLCLLDAAGYRLLVEKREKETE